ncbi:MAG: hypothetical protein RLZZ490_2500, partial [Cyanobacteriota bacterium]
MVNPQKKGGFTTFWERWAFLLVLLFSIFQIFKGPLNLGLNAVGY